MPYWDCNPYYPPAPFYPGGYYGSSNGFGYSLFIVGLVLLLLIGGGYYYYNLPAR